MARKEEEDGAVVAARRGVERGRDAREAPLCALVVDRGRGPDARARRLRVGGDGAARVDVGVARRHDHGKAAVVDARRGRGRRRERGRPGGGERGARRERRVARAREPKERAVGARGKDALDAVGAHAQRGRKGDARARGIGQRRRQRGKRGARSVEVRAGESAAREDDAVERAVGAAEVQGGAVGRHGARRSDAGGQGRARDAEGRRGEDERGGARVALVCVGRRPGLGGLAQEEREEENDESRSAGARGRCEAGAHCRALLLASKTRRAPKNK